MAGYGTNCTSRRWMVETTFCRRTGGTTTKNITLIGSEEVILVVMPEYSEVCIESGGYRVHLTIDEWEHLIEAWQEWRPAAE